MGGNEGELEETHTGLETPTGGSKDKVDSESPDNSLNTVENKEPEAGKPPEKKEGDPKTNLETDITEIIIVKNDKGQQEKERKEEQVNGKPDQDKVGPNDVIAEGDNRVEIIELETTKNNTGIRDTKDTQEKNNTIDSPELGKKILPTRINITQYTLYRGGGEESGKQNEKTSVKEEKTEKFSTEKTKEEREEKEKEKEVNQSFPGKRLLYKNKNEHHPLPVSLHPHFCQFLSCREMLSTSPSTLPRLPPAGARDGV